jgi:arginine-tRNA-protein transferase
MISEYFFATALSEIEFNELLIRGWRRFGMYFFKPSCNVCFECVPIRVRVNEFVPTKSMLRVINKNKDTVFKLEELKYSDEVYEIYREHSIDRFGKKTNKDDFKMSFFQFAVPAFLSKYYVNDKLVGAGILDKSNEAFSSAYFMYKTDYDYLSLGTYSVIREIQMAKEFGLKYYYLGYYIKDNHSMSYKARFKPHDLYDWHKNNWESNI